MSERPSSAKQSRGSERDWSRVWLGVVVAAVAVWSAGCPNGGDGEDTGVDTGATADADTSGPSDGGDADGGDGYACGADASSTWYRDQDGDGYGTSNETKEACQKPDGYVAQSGDCDDEDGSIHPGATETCDGVDEDCDGTGDASEDDIEPTQCMKTAGVCSGAMVSTCNNAGTDYATCGADQYGSSYRLSDDEGWRCDGKNNDCDANTDEACCASGTQPSPTQIGNSGKDQSSPVIVEASSNAPSGAKFLVAWAQSSTLHLWHVDESGGKVGGNTVSLAASAESLDVAGYSGGYGIFAANGVNQLKGIRLDASLSRQGSKRTLNSKTTGNLGGISASANGNNAWVAYSFKKGSAKFVVRALKLNMGTGNIVRGPVVASPSGETYTGAVATDTEIVGGSATVVWWDNANARIRGVRVKVGTSNPSFHVSVGNTTARIDEPVALFGRANGFGLVYPDFPASGKADLKLIKGGTSATGKLSGAVALEGNSDTNRQPAAVGADTNDDGTAERLVVAWARGSSSDPAIVVGSTSLSSPSTMSGRVVKASGNESEDPKLAGSSKLGLTWLETVMGTKRDVEYAPISPDGVPVCSP